MARADDPATAYARRVVSGKQVAGPLVRGACRRHLDDLKRRDIFFDREAAARVYSFYEDFLYVLMSGEDGLRRKVPFKLIDWQQFVVGSLMGWKWRKTGLRRYTKAFVVTGKGSGKSPLAAGLGLWMSGPDNEEEAEVIVAASNFQQAGVLFGDIVKMLDNTPELAALFEVKGGRGNKTDHIFSPTLGSTLTRIAFDTKRSGFRPHFVSLDEIHEMDGPDLWNEMVQGSDKGRPQPLVLGITNTGEDKFGIFGDLFERAEQAIVPGARDDNYFAYVCCLDEDDEDTVLDDEKLWPKANPSLGQVATYESYRRHAHDAKTQKNSWASIMRLQFCVPKTSSNPMINEPEWKAALVDKLPDTEGMPMVLGIDLAYSTSGTAFACLWHDEENDRYLCRVNHYLPAGQIAERERRERFPYSRHKKDGYQLVTPGKVLDFPHIVDVFKGLIEGEDFRCFSHDTFRLNEFHQHIEKDGMPVWRRDPKKPHLRHHTGFEFKPHGMGPAPKPDRELWMTDSIFECQTRIATKRLLVERNPVTTFQVLNATVLVREQGNATIERGKYNERPVDAAVAICVAIGAGRATFREKKLKPLSGRAFD